MRMLNRLSVVLLASASVIATPAAATDYLFDSNGDNATIYFNGFNDAEGDIPGLTSSLYLILESGIGTDVLTFSYLLTNTSTGDNSGSSVKGFAFNSTPDALDGEAVSGEFGSVHVGDPAGNYPNGIGDVEVCLSNTGSCAGGGNAGATVGDPASGVFTLEYGNPVASLYLSDFWVRYQSTGANQQGSATGGDTPPVPEPSTWAMMLFGFGALGFAMRRRRGKETLRVRYA
jgi:hypothetical protein